MKSAKSQIVRRLSSNLLHEVTHAVDFFGDPGKYVGFGMDPERYFNQPQEFRAYSKQIITKALGALPKLERLKYRKGVPPLPKVVEDLLQASETFEGMGSHFNRSNQNRLRQMLVREIQDSGIL